MIEGEGFALTRLYSLGERGGGGGLVVDIKRWLIKNVGML
jgi:hypothetical protein